MTHEQSKKWTIEPTSSLFDLKIDEAIDYRDLLWLLVRRDFVSFYKQTILGPLWFFIQPIFTVLIYSLIFGNLAGISTEGIPQPLFYLAGIVTWNYFSDCLIKTSTVFKDNATVFGKVYFPRIIMPLSIVFSNMVRFGVQLLMLFVLMGYYFIRNGHFQVTWYILLFPILVMLMALLGLGLGMIISALTNKYKDLSFLVTFGVPLLMYTTTVVFPLSSAPNKYKWLISLNPMTTIIECFRYGFLGKGSVSWVSFSYTALFTAFILVIGIVIFNKVEKNFIDTV